MKTIDYLENVPLIYKIIFTKKLICFRFVVYYSVFCAIKSIEIMKKIVIFASGAGSNAERIILYFSKSENVKVEAVFCNNKKAGVIEKSEKLDVPVIIFAKEDLFDGCVLEKLNDFEPDLIVLAGFLLKFPKEIVEAYPDKIINIHPSLLPKYGGKGMYGMNIHQTVIENKETETGITIHYVNEEYDDGNIIFQQKIAVSEKDTPETIAENIHTLEHEFFPKVIEQLIQKQNFDK